MNGTIIDAAETQFRRAFGFTRAKFIPNLPILPSIWPQPAFRERSSSVFRLDIGAIWVNQCV
jgi:hypothetical protein